MHRFLLGLLASIYLCPVGVCQPPTEPDGIQGDGTSTVQERDRQPRTQTEEIEELKANLRQIHERLKRLELPSDPAALSPPLGGPNAPYASPTLPAVPPCQDSPPTPMSAVWKDGLLVSSSNDDFRVHVGGLMHFDAGWNAAGNSVQFGSGGIGELQDGAYFRRANLRIDGTLYQHIEWLTEFDFANNVDNDTSSSTQPIGSPSFVNVWIAVNDLPLLGTVRTGWMKEPIGFEHLTSSRWLNFMERTPGVGTLNLRSPGILMQNASDDERVTWAAGVYHVQNDNFGFGVGDGQYAETGRITWLPVFEDEGVELLHVGFGASHRHLNGDQIDFKARPSVRSMPGVLEPPLAETGTISGTTADELDCELVGVLGSWTFQSEYYCVFIHDAVFPNDAPPQGMARGTLFYQGAYAEILYFLTGETRGYDRKDAVFSRVVPLHNFNFWDGFDGCGAWQVGLRYAYLDLQNKGVNGATLNDFTLGLNWLLNPNAKVQWNLAIDHRESTPPGSSGWTYIFGTSVALDF
ncbi:MAG: OprO/OprP family phosphate-selective porin [Gemmataceae bacterium]